MSARDSRFDGVFFVAITSTGIYCRPVCPSRPAHPGNRRFFASAAAAERDGFRPCLRCRPELAPGRALVDAVPRLASTVADRIAAGALNAQPVGALASELHVSERHLRRALKREVGVSPVELAQTHRLLMAKRLLADTSLDMGRVAYASGFQSLRRFNAVVRRRYGMAPTALRRASRSRNRNGTKAGADTVVDGDRLRLSLAYRAPFAWSAILEVLGRQSTPGVECLEGLRYSRTVHVQGRSGVVTMEDVPDAREVRIGVSSSLIPAIMPLLAALRRLLDLDAEPSVIDARLADCGLRAHVEECPGLRVPGAIDGFEVAFLTLVHEAAAPASGAELSGRVVRALGDPVDGPPGLERVPPDAAGVCEAGEATLSSLGLPPRWARAAVTLAQAVTAESLRLSPGCDPAAANALLIETVGLPPALATRVIMRASSWPDAFPATDPALRGAAGADGTEALLERSEAWRPWRSYAALHLWRSPGLPVRTRQSPT